jgi:hypothetical protein
MLLEFTGLFRNAFFFIYFSSFGKKRPERETKKIVHCLTGFQTRSMRNVIRESQIDRDARSVI